MARCGVKWLLLAKVPDIEMSALKMGPYSIESSILLAGLPTQTKWYISGSGHSENISEQVVGYSSATTR